MFSARCNKDLNTEMTEIEEKLAQEEYEEQLLPSPSTAKAGEKAATKKALTDQSSRHTSTVKQLMATHEHIALKATCLAMRPKKAALPDMLTDNTPRAV